VPLPAPAGEGRVILAILSLSTAYAILRYNVFGGVAWTELPVYVSTQGISFGALTLLALSYLVNRRVPPGARAQRRLLARSLGISGFLLLAAHSVASVAILTRAYFPALFGGRYLSTAGEVSLWSGSLAALLFAAPALCSVRSVRRKLGEARWKRAQRLGYAALALTAVHVLAIGSRNWAAVSSWPGGLPPITLLSFLVCLAPIVARVVVGRHSA